MKICATALLLLAFMSTAMATAQPPECPEKPLVRDEHPEPPPPREDTPEVEVDPCVPVDLSGPSCVCDHSPCSCDKQVAEPSIQPKDPKPDRQSL